MKTYAPIKELEAVPTKTLADYLGKTPGFASQVKLGKSKLPTKYCIDVSKHFNIPLHALRSDVYPKQ